MRTTNLLCKVFLQHLHPLLSLGNFTALWLTILEFMDKYIKADMQTDLVVSNCNFGMGLLYNYDYDMEFVEGGYSRIVEKYFAGYENCRLF